MLQSEQELRKQFDSVVKTLVDHARNAAEASSEGSMKNLEQATSSICHMLDDSETLISSIRKTIDDARPAIDSAAAFSKQFDALQFAKDFDALTQSILEVKQNIIDLENSQKGQGDKFAQLIDGNVYRIVSEFKYFFSKLNENIETNKWLLIGLYALVTVINISALIFALGN